jgi:hypothetical protein
MSRATASWLAHPHAMPVISVFFGIIIRMFHNEHAPPHFHASYQGFEALIRIDDGSILIGSLPKKAQRLVQEWADRHRAELMENWQRGVDMLPMQMIVGADLDD